MASLEPIKQKTLAEKMLLLDKITDKVNKKFGKTIMGRIGKNPEIEEKLSIKYIPTACPDLNKAISGKVTGGFPRRRCSIITGIEDSGKIYLNIA